ncbi:MAG: AAA family ATPase [Candidatus Yonathbacteria bacterium]|nr:AAA family ATPase [Candidatus Yonathbacteria bacterium]NTW47783.1 AAA family ATPase [Candidatus Yonathbacteria bacterium]
MLKSIEISGFKSFAKKGELVFSSPVSAIVGPNGSGKSNVTEAMRFVLGEQSMKSLRSKRGEDLIWSGSQAAPRANRASVEMTFDNRDRVFDVAFDEVTIRRVVSRDGSNEYFLNGSPVRLKDVMELLAQVHIGASGHHIISQGEADRILNTSSKERRGIIEDALGLKIYHWKIAESEKKLGKTEENMKEVESLRREIAPHIRFLKKQVEKIEAAEALRGTLAKLYAEYLKRESIYLSRAGDDIARDIEAKEAVLASIDARMQEAEARVAREKEGQVTPESPRIADIEKELSALRAEKDERARALGRIEGTMDAVKRRRERMLVDSDRPVAHTTVVSFADEVRGHAEEGERADDILDARSACSAILGSVRDFATRIKDGASDEELADVDAEYARLEAEYADVARGMDTYAGKEDALLRERMELFRSADVEKTKTMEAERAIYTLRAERSEITATLGRVRDREVIITRDKTAYEEEIREGMVLVGRAILAYEEYTCEEADVLAEPRHAQEDRRRAIERIKIKLEDAGVGGGGDVMKEYNEVMERDTFLARELEDLQKGATSLHELIVELRGKLDIEFKEGLRKINTQFQEYFALMFGGGTASLEIVKQKKRVRKDEEIPDERAMDDMEGGLNADDSASAEEGIDIAVSLPRKKIRGLQMLSGGERALTSIALIFAMSQVNPPPFLVLDETDAALDEANSRRYGDMLENLARRSQLIVVTHNRETMSRAGVLYGVTMGSDAASRLLSVKFEEAAAYAK